ncbi:MAG: transcriptional regulator [Thermoplasmata archaeon]|nr:transcriptional regulator [Thermoplasmata archaeon]
MMQKGQMVADTQRLLEKAGFATTDPKDLAHAGFDIVARRDQAILIVKVVTNANSMNDEMLAGMTTLANAVNGSPILVGLKSGNDTIEDGVMYSRSGIALISMGTFRDLIEEGVPPLVYAAGGGFYVNVDSEVLRKAREGGLSLGDIADMAGVSRRTIRMYEDGMNAKLEVAMRLEEGLGVELILPADPFTCQRTRVIPQEEEHFEGLTRDIYLKLSKIGYSVDPATKCPFDAVTRDRDIILFTGVDLKKPGLEKRAKAIACLSRILEKHSVIFVDKVGVRVNLEGTPLVGTRELERVKDKRKMMDLIEERL